MFGSHLSVAGGLENALIEAARLGLDCVQIFTRNQRQWSAKPLTAAQIQTWEEHLRRSGLRCVVSHDSYLVNLASPERETREKSIRLFIDEIERCEALRIPYLVSHPGSHVGIGEAKGLSRVAQALDRVHRSLKGYKTVTCLETTAGQGSSLGWRFEHLRRIIDKVREPGRLAVCFDTAHAFAAGYELTSAASARGVFEELDAAIGLDLVRVFHINDSKAPLGARVDRHEHIGRGHIPPEAFGWIVRERRFAKIPKILETPKGTAGDGRPWDLVNLETLKNLAKKR
ncbi:MAG: deoxyribonuclease IV [Planctomycetes bacterium]|nr:deoxyribonuclease IV [Planctomycetota bacterium]